MANDYKLTDFAPAREFVTSGRGGAYFDTEDKLDWFLRMHRDELIEAGEFIPGRGSRPSLIGPRFDVLAVGILRRTGGKAA